MAPACGLSTMASARLGDITYTYRDLANGGEIDYATSNPALIEAVHVWFDAQLRDHGHDASDGSSGHDMSGM